MHLHKDIGDYDYHIYEDEEQKWLKKAAEYGSSDAYYRLAVNIKISSEPNDDNAKLIELKKEYLEKAIELYSTPAMRYMSSVYLHDTVRGKYRDWLPLNIEKGVELLETASSLGDEEAQFRLALFYWYGKFVSRNDQKAWFLMKALAKKNNVHALYELTDFFFEIVKSEEEPHFFGLDINFLFSSLKKVAERNNPAAQFRLGKMYILGFCPSEEETNKRHFISRYGLRRWADTHQTPDNMNEGWKWIETAAHDGCIEAQEEIAKHCDADPKCVKQKYQQLDKRILVILALKGNRNACLELADRYRRGLDGFEISESKARYFENKVKF